MGDETPAMIWREQRPGYTVEVRLDGMVVVQVLTPLDDSAARDLSSALHHAANQSEAIRRPRRGNDGDDPF